MIRFSANIPMDAYLRSLRSNREFTSVYPPSDLHLSPLLSIYLCIFISTSVLRFGFELNFYWNPTSRQRRRAGLSTLLCYERAASKEGVVKDSAFLGVRLADGLKLETSSHGLRTKRVSTSVAIRAQTAAVSSPSVTPASPSGKKTLRKGTAVITGASSGLGLATAKALAETGKWHVIMACRDFLKASRAAKAAGMDKDSFTIVHLDLASLDSVRQFVKNVRQLEMPIDVVVCNAAVYQPTAKEPSYTADGFEMSVGVNHLGHFLLARELLDDLTSSDYPSKRLIIVGSITGNTNTLAGNVPPKANLGDLRGLAGGLNGVGSSAMIDGGAGPIDNLFAHLADPGHATIFQAFTPK